MGSDQSWGHDIFDRHLEQVSVLYDQRVWLKSPDSLKRFPFAADALINLENRIDTCIDVLAHGGKPALALCVKKALHGDAGDGYGAVRVLARMGERRLLESLLRKIPFRDSRRLEAAADALCHESPEILENGFLQDFMALDSPRVRIAARAAGYHRIDCTMDLLYALRRHSGNKTTALTLIHALGRLKNPEGAEGLLSQLHSRDPDIVSAAVTALTRMGEFGVLNECMAFIGPGNWPLLPLALYGNKESLSDSFFNLPDQTGTVTGHALATGLIGDTARIPDLIAWLKIPDRAQDAALALDLITGGGLRETEALAEEMDEDELFDDEIELIRKGENPFPGKTTPHVERLSRNPRRWQDWWRTNQGFFDPEKRYRNGKPYDPMELVRTMESRTRPDMIRSLAYDEMVIRYGIDIPFETDMPVERQRKAIAAYRQRLNGSPDAFTCGLWYVNGSPMDSAPLVRLTQEHPA